MIVYRKDSADSNIGPQTAVSIATKEAVHFGIIIHTSL